MTHNDLPTGVTMHGHCPRPAAVAGILPRGSVSALHLKSVPALAGPVVAEIAVGAAAETHLCALSRRQGDEALRSLSGLLRPSVSHQGELVVVLTAGGALDLQNAIEANALTRGVRSGLPIAIVRCHPDVGDISAFEKIRTVEKAVGRKVGLIVVIADEAPTVTLSLASIFPTAAVLLVTKTGAGAAGARLTIETDTLTYDPGPGMGHEPFQVKFAKDQIAIDGEPVMILQSGPRRAWTPATKPVAVAPAPVGRPSSRAKAMFVYLNRQLTSDELDLMGDSVWTIDRAHALKLAAQTTGPAVIAVVHAPDRDAGRTNATSDLTWLRAEIRHQNLEDKIEVELAPFGIPFRGPDRVIAA